jgi:hypothetical protein
MIADEPRLWQAVILRALQDAVWVDPNPEGRRGARVPFCGASIARVSAMRLRDEAAFWLLMDERDFTTVCENAGLLPSQVRDGARKILGASHEQKSIWSANGFSVSDLWGVREPRSRRLRAQRQG